MKLEHNGIRGTTLKLLKDYLNGREQYIHFNGVDSKNLQMEFGVPQGSVLGPLLFLIYINDLVNSSDEGKFVLFADDTNIFVSGKSEEDVYIKAQNVLNDVQNYMIVNQLHINMTKSVFMHFRPYLNENDRKTCARARIDKSLKISNIKIKRVTEVKFLGVIIDDELSWEPEINYLKGKLISSIVIIKRIKHFIPTSEYLKLYDSLFKSHLIYCISSWGGISRNKLDNLFVIQKRCIRLLFGKIPNFDQSEFYETCARVRPYQQHVAKKNYILEHTKPIFNEMGLLSLHHLHVYHTFLDMFKILKFKSPITLYELFTLTFRSTGLLAILPETSYNIVKCNFIFKASSIWNSLIEKVMNKCEPLMNQNNPALNGIIIPGSVVGSDLAASFLKIKQKLKNVLLDVEKLDTPGQLGWVKSDEWLTENFFTH